MIIQMLKARQSVPETTPEQVRAAFENVTQIFKTPEDVNRTKVDADGVPAEWISAPNATDAATIFYLHGGGYAIGSVNTHAEMVSRLSRASGARALSVDYRLAPENPFPAGLDDAVTAYRWLLNQGVDPKSVVIGGDSAGGGLTLATLLALRDAGDRLPAGAILLSPWTDPSGSGESRVTRRDADPMINPDLEAKGAAAYAGTHELTNPLISPLLADLSGLPPMLIHVGDAEVLLSDSTRLAEKAEAAGVDVTLKVWDEMIHVFQFFPMLPEGQQAVTEIGQWIGARIPAKAAA
jgi:acetyl esterase/lipase